MSARRSDGYNFHVIDFMDWLSGEASTAKGRTVFGEGGRHGAGRQTTQGKRRLQHNYETKPVEGVTPEEIDELRQIFEFYDVDNSKTMDLHELKMAICSLGYNPEDDEVADMAAMMDVDGDRTVDFSEFCMIIEHMKQQKSGYGELRDSFRCIDPLKDGFVSAEDLTKLLNMEPDGMKLNQINSLIKFADKNNTGLIDYEDFISRIKEEGENRVEEDSKSMEDASRRNSAYLHPERKLKNEKKTKEDAQKKKNEKKKKEAQKMASTSSKRNVEAVDNLAKALGGPILLTGAIIITSSVSTKKSRWPSVKRVLKLKRKKEYARKLEKAEMETLTPQDEQPYEEERVSLLEHGVVRRDSESNQAQTRA